MKSIKPNRYSVLPPGHPNWNKNFVKEFKQAGEKYEESKYLTVVLEWFQDQIEGMKADLRKDGKAMAKEHLYTVAKTGKDQWHVVKLNKVLKIEEGHYEVTRTVRNEWLCDCPAGHLTSCRHREMVHIFTRARKIGKDALYNFDKKTWVL